MRYRLFAAVLVVCLAATAGTLSVDQLYSFVRSSVQSSKEGKQTDKETADFLATTKLTERLDDRSVEQMESLGIGQRTLAALRRLRDQSQTLAAAKPIEPPAPPRQAPPPSSEEQAAIIDEGRAYALDYSKSLPDFICTQVTRRYAAPPPGTRYGGNADSEPSWQSQDTLTIRLSYFGLVLCDRVRDHGVPAGRARLVSHPRGDGTGGSGRGVPPYVRESRRRRARARHPGGDGQCLHPARRAGDHQPARAATRPRPARQVSGAPSARARRSKASAETLRSRVSPRQKR